MEDAETPVQEVKEIVNNISTKAEEWKAVSVKKKIALLKEILQNAIECREEWMSRQHEARGISATDPLHGYGRLDALVSGPATLGSYLNGIISSLESMQKSRPSRTTSNGKQVVTVFPQGLLEAIEAYGMKGELVLSKGDGNLQFTIDEAAVGGVAAVLGAGNFDAPIDVLGQMFLKARVCVYKPNPINQRTTPVLKRILDPLVRSGYLVFLSGGGDVGGALVNHNHIDEIVLTGSKDTFNRIKWGSTSQEQENNKRSRSPILKKPICAELGAVNPWIIVPGDQWNKRTVDKHARALAFAKMANNGYICASPQLVIVAEDWKWRSEFMERVRFWLGEHPGAPPYYPRSAESHSFFQTLTKSKVVQGKDAYQNQQRPILISNVDITDEEQSVLLQREAWCPVLAEVPLPNNSSDSSDPLGFLKSAVSFTENEVHGSLSICILIDDKITTKKAKEFDSLIADIPYGVVGVNIWPLFANSMPKLTWGAFPGHDASGEGQLGNAYLYKNVEKAVVRAPFRYLGRRAVEIMPPRKANLVFSRLTTYKLNPRFSTQAAMFAALFVGL